VVERAPVKQLFDMPQHPYTVGLLASVPRLDGDEERLASIEGQVPNALRIAAGCKFADRCPFRDRAMPRRRPAAAAVGEHHLSACWRAPLDPSVLVPPARSS
jgi:peptide/nickel transport system ATP-binding protein